MPPFCIILIFIRHRIEIINLKYFLEDKIINNILWGSNIINYSYDDEVDAFYSSLTNDKYSENQECIEASAIIGNNGNLLAIIFELNMFDQLMKNINNDNK